MRKKRKTSGKMLRASGLVKNGERQDESFWKQQKKRGEGEYAGVWRTGGKVDLSRVQKKLLTLLNRAG